jgi:fucose 4-O-acetylase-like acetyltransferase
MSTEGASTASGGESGTRRRRDPVIDSLRCYGLVAVVLQHAVGYPAYAGNTVALALLGAAVWAVPALFATSGYLSALRPGGTNLGRRFRRLLVPYVVWSIVLFAYLHRGELISGSLPPLGASGWLGIVFAGQAYYTLWFLAMLVYATLAGWVLTTNRARLAGVIVSGVLLGVLTVLRWGQPAESQQTWVGFITFAPVCIGLYLLGAMLATVRERVSGALVPLAGLVAGVVVDVAISVGLGTALTEQVQLVVHLGAALAGFALLVIAISPSGRVMGFRATAFAGTFALGIYVLHAPILGVLQSVSGTTESANVVIALVLGIITFGVSLLVSVVASKIKLLAPLFK